MPKILTNEQAAIVAEELCCSVEYVNNIAVSLTEDSCDATAVDVMNYLMGFLGRSSMTPEAAKELLHKVFPWEEKGEDDV